MGPLAAGSAASLAANVAVAEPTLVGRVIAAWHSFASTASYELLTRQVRRWAADMDTLDHVSAVLPLTFGLSERSASSLSIARI